jgi:hypothetical protein
MPQFLPQRDRWYCYEMMLRLNTPGQKNGEVKVWVDGQLAADWPNVSLRTVNTLKIDKSYLGLHATSSQRNNQKWYDNVVMAREYIGPMKPVKPTPTPAPTATVPPSPSPTPSATASPTASPTPSPSPTPTPTPQPTATATPTPSATPSASLVTVTVEWQATIPDEYSIFYGKTSDANDMQVYGGKAWAAGPMCVAIANLDANTTYYFTNAVTWHDVTGPRLQPPVAYTTNAAPNQKVNLP